MDFVTVKNMNVTKVFRFFGWILAPETSFSCLSSHQSRRIIACFKLLPRKTYLTPRKNLALGYVKMRKNGNMTDFKSSPF